MVVKEEKDMRIGKYYIAFKEQGSFLFPLIVILFCLAYLTHSMEIFSKLGMILVRIVVYTIAVFILLVLREEIQITTKKEEKPCSYKISSFLTLKAKKIWYFILVMGLYIFLIDKLGFILSTALFTSIMMYILGIKNKKTLIFTPVFLLIFLYLMFQKWLMIPFPTGIFGL
jgi:type III secretory pathway component EscU